MCAITLSKMRYPSFAVLALLLVANPGFTAVKTPSKKKTAETYSAIDASPGAQPVLEDYSVQFTYKPPKRAIKAMPARQKNLAKVQNGRSTIRSVKLAPEKSIQSRRDVRSAERFDTIPESQISRFRDRLQLVDEILARSGRAYDYKSLTVNELETLLRNLTHKSAETLEREETPEFKLPVTRPRLVPESSEDDPQSPPPDPAAEEFLGNI